MVKNNDAKGFLIDGYPRDVSQGEKFEKEVKFFYIKHRTTFCQTLVTEYIKSLLHSLSASFQ